MLTRAEDFAYLTGGNCVTLPSVDDKKEWARIVGSFKVYMLPYTLHYFTALFKVYILPYTLHYFTAFFKVYMLPYTTSLPPCLTIGFGFR